MNGRLDVSHRKLTQIGIGIIKPAAVGNERPILDLGEVRSRMFRLVDSGGKVLCQIGQAACLIFHGRVVGLRVADRSRGRQGALASRRQPKCAREARAGERALRASQR